MLFWLIARRRIEMARRTIEMIELEEVLYQWIKGIGIKGISRSLGISRNTVKKIILQAQQAGLRAILKCCVFRRLGSVSLVLQ
jgi:hypothetical protein